MFKDDDMENKEKTTVRVTVKDWSVSDEELERQVNVMIDCFNRGDFKDITKEIK